MKVISTGYEDKNVIKRYIFNVQNISTDRLIDIIQLCVPFENMSLTEGAVNIADESPHNYSLCSAIAVFMVFLIVPHLL